MAVVVAAALAAAVASSVVIAQSPQSQPTKTKSPWVYYPLDTVEGEGGPAPKRDLSGTWAGPGDRRDSARLQR